MYEILQDLQKLEAFVSHIIGKSILTKIQQDVANLINKQATNNINESLINESLNVKTIVDAIVTKDII